MNQPLHDTLRILAAPFDQKRRWIPRADFDFLYRPPGEDEDVLEPAKALLMIANERTAYHGLAAGDPALQPLYELQALLDLLVRADPTETAWMCWLDKGRHGVTSPSDHLWDVLQRLALAALGDRPRPADLNNLNFHAFLRDAGFRRMRIVPDADV